MNKTKRPSARQNDELRNISIEAGIMQNAEGSALITWGNNKILCTASVEEFVPKFLRNTGSGWVTAEYGMLPRATQNRTDREAVKGKQSGRTVEIQRLIGRSLRAGIDLSLLGERQIIIDCDVLQADGGTRVAAITGGYVAMHLACHNLLKRRLIKTMPIKNNVAAVSCGIYMGDIIVDLDYLEDNAAEVDGNFVMTSNGRIVEIQVSGEENDFSEEQFSKMINIAKNSIEILVKKQNDAIDRMLN